jgi:hypothetical protein
LKGAFSFFAEPAVQGCLYHPLDGRIQAGAVTTTGQDTDLDSHRFPPCMVIIGLIAYRKFPYHMHKDPDEASVTSQGKGP